ncbi:putative membrane protein [Bacillus cereus]|nr:putative membrane protein [Bacillus cereus]
MIKLFIRDHIPLICFTAIQLLSIFLVYWFDGHKHIATALYAMFLGAFFMPPPLVFRYFTHRTFYERLANQDAIFR